MIFLRFIILYSVFCILASCGVNIEVPAPSEEQDSSGQEWRYTTDIDDIKKVELAQARRFQIDKIRKGDYMITKNNPQEALTYYLPVLEELPGDIVLERKIAIAYTLMKSWKEAYEHFVRVPLSELSAEDRKMMMHALFFDETAPDRQRELTRLSLSPEEQEYFLAMHSCYSGIDACVEVLKGYEWHDSRLLSLREVITSASHISDDHQYRNFLLAVRLYEQEMYRLSGMITSEILAVIPQYEEVKKLRAFSLYELGKYEEARAILLEYLEGHPDDLEVIVRLGEIGTFLGDYVTANLYLNNAILAGYTPKTLLERRLAYNYAKIGDNEGMKKVLVYLLQEEDVAEDDFAVAISLAFSQNENIRAYAWAHEGMKRFPESKMLAPLYIQALRSTGKYADAESFLQNLAPDVQRLPLVQLEKAILLFHRGDTIMAKAIFTALRELDPRADFAYESEDYLIRIRVREIQEMHQHTGALMHTDTSFSP